MRRPVFAPGPRAHLALRIWHSAVRRQLLQEIDPTPDDGGAEALDGGVGGGFLSELAGSIPGIDEAMSFAEVMKQVGLLLS